MGKMPLTEYMRSLFANINRHRLHFQDEMLEGFLADLLYPALQRPYTRFSTHVVVIADAV